MKLCQRCYSEIDGLNDSVPLGAFIMSKNEVIEDESECEFYVHKQYNELLQTIESRKSQGWTEEESSKR